MLAMALPSPRPKYSRRPPSSVGDEQLRILHELQEKMHANSGPATLEVPMPTVGPKRIIFDWTHPAEKKFRHRCPITMKEAKTFVRFDLTAFERYLKLNTKQRSELSRNVTILNLKRFFYLIEIEEGDFHPVGVLCALYKQNVLAEMKDAPLLNSRYGWAREMDTSLKHYIEHMKSECNKQQPRCSRNNM